MIFQPGEKIHIIERRYFVEDLRRHFAGEITECTDTVLRIQGYAWVFDVGSSEFVRKPEKRERVIHLGERLTINVMPPDVDVDELKYENLPEGRVVTDGKNFSLEISEFSATR